MDRIPEEFRDKVIAVDFDGTLFEKKRFPGFGAPNLGLIATLRFLQKKRGCKLILWTCREGADLEMALTACGGVGLHFDAVNEGLPGENGTSRKISADIYIDDKAVNPLNQIPYYLQPEIYSGMREG